MTGTRWKRLVVGGVLLVACAATIEPVAVDPAGADVETRPVTIFAPYRGDEAASFLADLSSWADAHSVDLKYTGTGNVAGDLQFRIANADPPDIALVPQPGLVAKMYEDGDIRALSPGVERAANKNLAPGARSLGVVGGVPVGIPYRVNAKGLVWYRTAELAALGLEPPRTLAGFDRLVAALDEHGLTPWCFGVEDEGATGWAATDWVENLVLREWGTAVYQDWVTGTIPFADPRIRASFEHFRKLVLAPGRLVGGVARALATPVSSASTRLLADPPGCALYQQASFAQAWFPSGESVGPGGSVDHFIMPNRDDSESPLVVGADVAVAFTDRPEVNAVMRFLATPAAARTWVGAGGFLSPQRGLDLDRYRDPSDRVVIRELLKAPVLVLDGSDAMPPEIGTDLFWDRITKWMAGAITYDELAADLDERFAGSSVAGATIP